MNGLDYWWQKHEALRNLLKEFKKENNIKGDVFEIITIMLEKLEKAIRIIEGTAISDSRKKCNDMSNKFLKEISEKSEGK